MLSKVPVKMEAMDRPLDSSVLKLRLLKRVAVAVLIVSGLVLAFGGFRRLITPSLDGKRIRTAVVEQGRIEATITASGTVVPEFEETLSSPIDSRVLEVLKRPGETVRRGDPILALDTSAQMRWKDSTLVPPQDSVACRVPSSRVRNP